MGQRHRTTFSRHVHFIALGNRHIAFTLIDMMQSYLRMKLSILSRVPQQLLQWNEFTDDGNLCRVAMALWRETRVCQASDILCLECCSVFALSITSTECSVSIWRRSKGQACSSYACWRMTGVEFHSRSESSSYLHMSTALSACG